MPVVIVTGAFGALGRIVVNELTSRGYKVAAVDVAPAKGESEAAMVLGGIDLTDEGSVNAAYAKVTEKLGGLDALVNIAGGFTWEPIETGSIDSWDNMFRINLRTAAVSIRAALPH